MATVRGTEQVQANLETYRRRSQTRVEAAITRWARVWESTAKQNAPWQDRTGNARRGLQAIPDFSGAFYTINLTDQVSYSVYLETKPVERGGRPIIWPTTIQLSGLFKQMVQEALSGGA